MSGGEPAAGESRVLHNRQESLTRIRREQLLAQKGLSVIERLDLRSRPASPSYAYDGSSSFSDRLNIGMFIASLLHIDFS